MYKSTKAKSVAKPKRKADKTKDRLFDETENTIKEGTLRKSLKLKDSDKSLTMREINMLMKQKVGDTVDFRGKKVKVTAIMMKRLQLAKNMMKKK